MGNDKETTPLPYDAAPDRAPVRVALDVRVLQGDDAFRGIGHYTRGLTEALLRLAAAGRAGVEYALLTAAERRRPDLRTEGAAAIVDVEAPSGGAPPEEACECPFERVAERLAERLTGRERGAGALLRAARAARARVLHVASPLHGPFPWAPWRGGRTVATFYDLIPLLCAAEYLERWSPEARRRYRRRLAALSRLDALFAISRSAADDAVAHADVRRGRVHVAYPGLRPAFLEPAGPGNPGEAPPYVLAFASANPSKNTALLLAAWRAMPVAARAGHVLRLVGPAAGRGDPGWDAAAADGSVAVVAEPGDAALARLYAGAACFVCPSRAEGFGLPPLEAAACGAPVVASDIAVLREVLGDAAEYFAPDSVDELAGLLGRVLGDAALRTALAARGRQRAREFAWERTAREVACVHARLGRAGT